MKIIIYVFTGTGNTLKVAHLYEHYFQADTVIYQIKEPAEPIPNPNDYDLIGFGYPVHAFNPPEVFVQFIKRLPKVYNKKCFIFKTAGEGLRLNNGSSQKSIRILEKKGFTVLQERHIIMPYNIIYRHTDGMAKQMWIYAKAMVDLNTWEMKAGKTENVHLPFFKTWHAPLFRIEWWWARFHGTWFKADKKKCIDCGMCLRDCPMHNITRTDDGTYQFHHRCALCMRCSFYCPADAIHVGIFKYWKVHGDYKVERLAKDPSVPFPFLDGHEKGVYKMYRKYFRVYDKRLKEANMDINNYRN